jgi:hypothetical protein
MAILGCSLGDSHKQSHLGLLAWCHEAGVPVFSGIPFVMFPATFLAPGRKAPSWQMGKSIICSKRNLKIGNTGVSGALAQKQTVGGYARMGGGAGMAGTLGRASGSILISASLEPDLCPF